MYRREVVIKNEHGLHARPASQFMQKASTFQSHIDLQIEDKVINGKSILALLSAGIRYDSKITILAEGEDEEQAAEELATFIESFRD